MDRNAGFCSDLKVLLLSPNMGSSWQLRKTNKCNLHRTQSAFFKLMSSNRRKRKKETNLNCLNLLEWVASKHDSCTFVHSIVLFLKHQQITLFSSTQSDSAGRKHFWNHMGASTADERRFHCLHPSACCWQRVWSGTFYVASGMWGVFTGKNYYKKKMWIFLVEVISAHGRAWNEMGFKSPSNPKLWFHDLKVEILFGEVTGRLSISESVKRVSTGLSCSPNSSFGSWFLNLLVCGTTASVNQSVHTGGGAVRKKMQDDFFPPFWASQPRWGVSVGCGRKLKWMMNWPEI